MRFGLTNNTNIAIKCDVSKSSEMNSPR